VNIKKASGRREGMKEESMRAFETEREKDKRTNRSFGQVTALKTSLYCDFWLERVRDFFGT
jgi:hypothetical protein